MLSIVTDADLRNEQFRWLTAQTIEVAGIKLRALRVTYVGELGWELHVPMNQLEPLYDAVWSAGESFGIADFGLYAVNSLRMEKAYRAYGSELTTEITMIDADMERFVKFEKEYFIGKEALLKRKTEGSNFQLVYSQVSSSDSDIRGGEPVFDGDSVIGVTTSGAYGHTVGKQLIFAYVKPVKATPNSTFKIEILGKRYRAEVLSEPIYDPENKRIRS
ncbi:MAG: aminomethyltransferase family protein [Saprospiraceae bacterium]|nr:aminomethyltransferase family protein [Saprospiraceae bacterium]